MLPVPIGTLRVYPLGPSVFVPDTGDQLVGSMLVVDSSEALGSAGHVRIRFLPDTVALSSSPLEESSMKSSSMAVRMVPGPLQGSAMIPTCIGCPAKAAIE